jgi:hypothetical protein
VKIKEMLTTLLDGEDFSDHSTGKEDGNSPLHDKGCAFCDAWRMALLMLTPSFPGLIDFEPGERVMLPGGIRGRVIATDVAVRVEVQNGEHGPWAVGSFQPQDLSPRESESEFTYWKDGFGDVWEREESTRKVRRVALRVVGDKLEKQQAKAWADVRHHWTDTVLQPPVTRTEKP